MIDLKKKATVSELRVFGIGILVLGGIFIWWWNGHLAAKIICGLGAVTSLVSLVAPEALRPVYKVWMIVISPIAFLVSTIILAVVYYLVVTPVGAAKRLFSSESMPLSPDPNATTYWIEKQTDVPVDRNFKQY